MREESSRHLIRAAGWAARGWVGIAASSIADFFGAGLTRPWRRALWVSAVLPGLAGLLILDWIGLLLDEVLFRGYRKVDIGSPVFVVGPPRSGTTFLHRVLARDTDTFTTSPAWEALLAPSVTQKKLIRGVLALDRRCGRPLVKGFRRLEPLLTGAFEDTHPGSLVDPEEDYFYLGAVCACTGWALVFPGWRGIRRWMPGSSPESGPARRRALELYRWFLRKQLYVSGGGRRLLSKNASFASWMDVVPEMFPEARFLVCMRDPAEAVPSMLSTALHSVRGAYADTAPPRLRPELLREMEAHYQTLSRVVPDLPDDRALVVRQPDLKRQLPGVLRLASLELGLDFSPGFWDKVDAMGEESRAHHSRHAYSLDEFGLVADELRSACPVLDSPLPPPP